MSLESRISQMRQENMGENSPYALVLSALKKDREALFTHFKQNRGSQSLDEDLVDIYELRPTELPTLTLPNNLSFMSGFSYVVSQMYPLMRAVATKVGTPDQEQFMDSHLQHMFPDGNVTTQHLRDALSTDPTGTTWLEEMARIVFRLEDLELVGGRKAITGARKMYEQLTATA